MCIYFLQIGSWMAKALPCAPKELFDSCNFLVLNRTWILHPQLLGLCNTFDFDSVNSSSSLLIGNQMLIIASHFSPGFGDHLTRQFCPKWYKLACGWRILSDCYWTQYGWKKLLCSPGGSDCYNGSGRSNAISSVFLLWFSTVNTTTCWGCAVVLTLYFVKYWKLS